MDFLRYASLFLDQIKFCPSRRGLKRYSEQVGVDYWLQMQPGGIQYWGRFEAFRKEGLQIWTRYHKPLRTLRWFSLLRNGSSWNKFVIIMNNDDILALLACWNKYISKRSNLFVNCQIITMLNYYHYGGVNTSLLLILLILLLLLWSTKNFWHCKIGRASCRERV